MRITKKFLESKIDVVNGMLGHDEPAWNSVGSIHLYSAYGATGVHQVMNTSGGITVLKELGTVKEADAFLAGMITGLRNA